MTTVLEKNKTVTKQDFIRALRSGEYEQYTGGSMQSGAKVCAMMVWHKLNGDHNFDAPVGGDSILGVSINVYNRIAELNDMGYTFGELAMILQESVSDDLSNINY
jgi:hypothetical protein